MSTSPAPALSRCSHRLGLAAARSYQVHAHNAHTHAYIRAKTLRGMSISRLVGLAPPSLARLHRRILLSLLSTSMERLALVRASRIEVSLPLQFFRSSIDPCAEILDDALSTLAADPPQADVRCSSNISAADCPHRFPSPWSDEE